MVVGFSVFEFFLLLLLMIDEGWKKLKKKNELSYTLIEEINLFVNYLISYSKLQ
jgi:hypothetical protein